MGEATPIPSFWETRDGAMRIKKLEISGFKSFAERARLQFGDGITGVVGPNGCGKSNIVDAIRWCMGEMSAKHLRGKAMQDVIFAGSDSRGAQGMAEVTLTFHNDGNVPPAYMDYAEIAVTRRLFRDGTSEYLINKTQVRLRDVTDLFLGTGVGTRAYSIIEQGRIGFVINARPEERRSLIEEVAGITKFKARKKVAERRMEATEANLLRVNDVVAELERQLGTLRRQAKKAERYRELRGELRDLELHTAVLDLMRLSAEAHVYRSRQQSTEAKLTDTQAGLSADEVGLESARLALLDDEQRLQTLQQHSLALDGQISTLERDIAHWREQADSLMLRQSQAQTEITDAEQRLEVARTDHVRLTAEADEQERLTQYDGTQIEAASVRVDDATMELEAIDEQLDIARRESMEHVQGATQKRAHVASLERQRLDLTHRIERMQQRLDALHPEYAATSARQAELAQQRDTLQTSLDTWKQEQALVRQRLPELKDAVQTANQTLRAAQTAFHEKRSRLDSLTQIANRLEGYSDGVRTLMSEEAPPVAGILDIVTHVLNVHSDWEQAIESALGDRLQYLVVQEQTTAQQAIAHLHESLGGRGGFIPQGVQATPVGTVPQGPGIFGSALTAVQVSEAYQAVAEHLLGAVVLVDTLEHAQTLAQTHQGPWIWVSRNGDVVDAHGVTSGGSNNGAGLLANQREIRELQAEVLTHEAAVQQAQAQFESAEQARLNATSTLERLDQDTHRCELDVLKAAKDHEAADRDATRLQEQIGQIDSDLEANRSQCAQIEAEEATALSEAQAAESDKEQLEWRLEELQERRASHASQVQGHQEELTALKIRIAAQGEKAAAARDAVMRLAQQEQELTERIARTQTNAQQAQSQAQSLRENADAAQVQVTEQTLEAKAAHQSLAQARANYEVEQDRVFKLEQTLKDQRRGNESLQQILNDCRLQLQKCTLEQDNLAAHILERHDVVLAEQVPAYHTRPMPDASQVQRKEELERAIKNIGAINLTAIEECQEVETRYNFLSQQRDDLQEALSALRQAIARINKTSKERFTEAFHAVNDMFQKVYPRLFRGGSARLELTQSEDMLEAGIDIIAMPPGKKLQNVGLLSGGEKALTATALVFSIFLIKPSPFCILDEVDAPLDEANVGRFNEMLREISKVSQFIVITHNKQSMMQADKLYGITMEDAGMSKVVSVDLNTEQDEQAA